MKLGRQVMAVERNPEVVSEWMGKLTHVVEADSTNIEALRQVGAQDFNTAVVGIGTSIEASVLTTANLVLSRSGQKLFRWHTERSSSALVLNTFCTQSQKLERVWPTSCLRACLTSSNSTTVSSR